MVKKILQNFSKQQKKSFSLIVFLGLLGTLIEIVSLLIVYKLIQTLLKANQKQDILISFVDYNFKFNNYSFLTFLCFSLISIYILKLIFFSYLSHLKFSFVYGLRHKISKKLLGLYMNTEYIFFTKKNSAELLRNIDKDANYFADGVVLNLINIIIEFTILIGILIFLFYVNPFSTLYLLIFLTLIFFLFYFLLRKKIVNLANLRQLKNFEFIKNVNQNIRGIKDIKLFDKIEYFEKLFSKSSELLSNVNTKLMFLYSVTRYTIELIIIMCASLFVIFSIQKGFNLDDVLLTIGVYAAAAFRLLPSANKLIASSQRMISSIPSINVITNEQKEIKEHNIDQDFQINFNKKIVFEKINFSYNNDNSFSLSNISFEINKNEIFIIIGKSGSGKTTLVDILSGLVKPQDGKIFIDGNDYTKKYNLMRKNISYLSQNFFLLDDSILNNITFGSKEIDLNRINQIIKDLELEDFVKDSKDGLNTIVGEDGLQISGGQAQRIGLARCFYSNKDIIILDEATSALDIQTEDFILECIKNFKQNKTIVLITHRENVLKFSDKILILEDGKIKKK
jgi:ATP-binding cassette, subfamily B, bacterial PglK